MSFKDYLKEAMGRDYEVYHETLGAVQQEIERYAKDVLAKKGYTLTEENLMNPYRGSWEPVSYGTTLRLDFMLIVNNPSPRQKDKLLHVQIYRMDNGRYELNMYAD
jgi:hypothetical protein